MAMAEKARDMLAFNGGSVRLQTYEGGHGWHGDVYGKIRAGIEWLENEAVATQGPARDDSESPKRNDAGLGGTEPSSSQRGL